MTSRNINWKERPVLKKLENLKSYPGQASYYFT